ncbi:hypothetical protein DENIS_0890 [Desulfonema ishimotonii]|uniref:Teneurin-like YD-shell domain-containing protein n=2 Tax=Desulfonema ishimotonii TaxID=45657 RepID=A0A401FSL3_9BACT|nr:hypothetical protein DENIS_0890 [Desulfonema ishimotonii]
MTKGGQRYYLAYDQVGSLRAVTDASGNLVKRVEYDTFGNILTDSDPLFEVPFGFAGGLHDRDTGLVRFGYRDYDPDAGRWTAKDPILFAGGDTDLYGYCVGDPVDLVDQNGLWTVAIDASVTVGAGAGGTGGITYVLDSKGNFAKLNHAGAGGFGGVGAGTALQFQVSNAPDVFHMTGQSVATGGSVDVLPGIEATGEFTVMPGGYMAFNAGAGMGPGTPVEMHSMWENTEIVSSVNLIEATVGAIKSFIDSHSKPCL